MDVRKATPEETAAWLVGEYDRLIAAEDFSKPRHAKWAYMAKIAARLADFVAMQYSCDTPGRNRHIL